MTVAKIPVRDEKHVRELQILKLQVFIGYIGFFKDFIGLKI